MTEESRCHVCGWRLHADGECLMCNTTLLPQKPYRGSVCKECGAPMDHYRLYGYLCSANREHRGIVRPAYCRVCGGLCTENAPCPCGDCDTGIRQDGEK